MQRKAKYLGDKKAIYECGGSFDTLFLV